MAGLSCVGLKLTLEDWFAVSAQWDESEYEAYLAREGTIVGRRNGAGRKSSRYWFEESLHHYKCFLWSVIKLRRLQQGLVGGLRGGCSQETGRWLLQLSVLSPNFGLQVITLQRKMKVGQWRKRGVER